MESYLFIHSFLLHVTNTILYDTQKMDVMDRKSNSYCACKLENNDTLTSYSNYTHTMDNKGTHKPDNNGILKADSHETRKS